MTDCIRPKFLQPADPARHLVRPQSTQPECISIQPFVVKSPGIRSDPAALFFFVCVDSNQFDLFHTYAHTHIVAGADRAGRRAGGETGRQAGRQASTHTHTHHHTTNARSGRVVLPAILIPLKPQTYDRHTTDTRQTHDRHTKPILFLDRKMGLLMTRE